MSTVARPSAADLAPPLDGAAVGHDMLPTPRELRADLPASGRIADGVAAARNGIRLVLQRRDHRLLAVVGPCSVHDPIAALEYARRLSALRDRVGDRLLVVMRVYVEKPRTMLGWRGLVHDPRLDGSDRIVEGLRVARALLRDVASTGLPIAVEFVDPNIVPYLADLVSWVAIGARTTESPTHRQMASGLACAVGFKNTTSGSVTAAINGVLAARESHRILMVGDDGRIVCATTDGNADGHVILRGGSRANHDARSVERVVAELAHAGLDDRVLIDCGHGNAMATEGGQLAVARDVAEQLRDGGRHVLGVMLESNLVSGRQTLGQRAALRFGQSVTDPCVGFEETEQILLELASAQ